MGRESVSVQEQLDCSCVQNQFLQDQRQSDGAAPFLRRSDFTSICQGNERIQTSFCERVGGL